MDTKLLKEFLTKEMDRKEFLLCLGIIVITVTGISGILKSLSGIISQKEHYSKQEKGYGSKPYGI